jgi:GT2 family glycosyltransferase
VAPVKASVVIPNWNGLHLLRECLAALEQQSFRDFEIIVVDNGSSDDSVAWLQAQASSVRLIALDDNMGFSTAVNRGIEASEATYVVLLNNDTLPEPDWLARLVQGMDDQPQASSGASLILLHEPPHRIDSAGDGFHLKAGGFNIGSGETADRHAEPAWVFGACAGAAIYRRSLFDKIGLFDEDFFLVFEDVDLSLRAQLAGHRCLYIPDAVVYHHRGASTASASEEVILRSWRNHIWVAGKNLPPLLLIIWSALLVLRLGRLATYDLLTRRHPDIEAISIGRYLKSLRQALRGLPAKRRATAARRKLGSLSLLRRFRKQIIPASNDGGAQ